MDGVCVCVCARLDGGPKEYPTQSKAAQSVLRGSAESFRCGRRSLRAVRGRYRSTCGVGDPLVADQAIGCFRRGQCAEAFRRWASSLAHMVLAPVLSVVWIAERRSRRGQVIAQRCIERFPPETMLRELGDSFWVCSAMRSPEGFGWHRRVARKFAIVVFKPFGNLLADPATCAKVARVWRAPTSLRSRR